MNWPLFGSTFAVVFLAELPDKTIFATILMASRSRPTAVFIGAAGAFLVQTTVAVVMGSFFARLPARPVHMAAALLFLALAAKVWLEKDEARPAAEAAPRKKFMSVAWLAFCAIFLLEWGDLTQLATAALVARGGQPLTIFCAAVAALWAATAAAAAVGHGASRRFDPRLLKKASVVAMAVVGTVLLCREF